MNICLYFGVAPTVEDEGRLKNILLQKFQIQTTILLKESVEFSEPSFRMNFAESPLEVASETELRIFHFPFGSHFRTPLPSSERRNLKCSELRERELILNFGVVVGVGVFN